MYRHLPLIFLLGVTPLLAHSTDLQRAQEIVEQKCHLCHGTDGEASNAIYPRLAAQNAEYITKQLADFKSGRRKGTMNTMAADLTGDEMTAWELISLPSRQRPIECVTRNSQEWGCICSNRVTNIRVLPPARAAMVRVEKAPNHCLDWQVSTSVTSSPSSMIFVIMFVPMTTAL